MKNKLLKTILFVLIFQIMIFGNVSNVMANEVELPENNDIDLIFEYIINNENIKSCSYKNFNLLLKDLFINFNGVITPIVNFSSESVNSKNFFDYYYQLDFIMKNDNIRIRLTMGGDGSFQIRSIRINQNSKYLALFPYKNIDEYLLDVNFGRKYYEYYEYYDNRDRDRIDYSGESGIGAHFYFNYEGLLEYVEFYFSLG